MDKEALKHYLIENTDIVEEFLTRCGFYGIKYYENSNQWRFGLNDDSSTSAIKLSSLDLSYKDYKFDEKGDIFTLVMLKKGISFGISLDYVASKTGFSKIQCAEIECNFPYGEYYKQLKRITNLEEDLQEYDKELLNSFPKVISKLFLRDNISIATQEKWGIRYCSQTQRIVIPCYEEGKLIGAIGRINSKIVEKDVPKYLPILRYNKSQFVFGLSENAEHIKSSTVYVVESEKTVLNCDTNEIFNCVAVGGNNVSPFHRNKILRLNPRNIVVILDKGLGQDKADFLKIDAKKYMREVIIKEAQKFKNKFSDVYFVDCNDIGEVNEKENVFDLGLEKEEIIKIIDSIKEKIE